MGWIVGNRGFPIGKLLVLIKAIDRRINPINDSGGGWHGDGIGLSKTTPVQGALAPIRVRLRLTAGI